MAFSTFVSQYLDFAKLQFSEETFEEKLVLSKRFAKFLEQDRPVEEITAKHIMDYLVKQANERSANAANKDRKNLLAMWNWGQKILDLPGNPVVKVDKFPHEAGKQYTPPEQDIQKILACTTGVDRVFLQCYLNTGARRSEIFRLTWEDIDFPGRTIALKTRKTEDGTTRVDTIHMNETLHEELWWWWKNRQYKDEPWVFIDDHPGPHTGQPYKVRRRFMASLCEQAGVKTFGFHALRRYVASYLTDELGLTAAQLALRHTKASTTDRYVQRIKADGKGKDVFDALSGKSKERHLRVVGEE